MRSSTILARFYGKPVRQRRRMAKLGRRIAAYPFAWVRRHNLALVLGSMLLASWVATHVYYYNQLIVYEFDVKAAWAQVEAAQQKRNHVQRNLTRLLEYYAGYERGLMKEVTAMRAQAESSDGSESLFSLLGRLEAVAEQYPQPRLNQSVQQFSTSVIDTEAEISLRIMEYNSAVNRYTTVLNMFPGNVFGGILGFESAEYYVPEDTGVLEYKVLEIE